MSSDIVKETFEVSPAHPDKVVVNGCDLVNRAQLSTSQNRELQRFIDRNSHRLGFFDRPHDEKDDASQGRYNSLGFGTLGSRPYGYEGADHSKDSASRVESPYSEYGTYGSKRKGVKFADGVDSSRARSFSPSQGGLNPFGASSGTGSTTGRGGRGTGDDGGFGRRGSSSGYGQGNQGIGDNYGKNKRPTESNPDNYDPYGTNKSGKNKNLRSQTQSPATEQFKWRPYQSYEYDGKRNTVAPPIPQWLKDRSITPAYSSLQRHPDNYNKYDTEKHRHQLNRQSQEKDEEIKFYGFGDRLGSGIELTRKRWTGGELITDPAFVTKSIKPRTMFYSPIGDGVVAADGIELRRGPPDLTPKRYEYHEKVIEKGDQGRGGLKVTEQRWDVGNRGDADDDGRDRGGWPDDGNDGRGRKGPIDDGRGWPEDDGWPRKDSGDPFGTLGSGDGYPRSFSPLSIGTDGFPREGWTKTFITNPRELINQYGSETLTTIFDLKDHTPKTMTTIKETISPVP